MYTSVREIAIKEGASIAFSALTKVSQCIALLDCESSLFLVREVKQF